MSNVFKALLVCIGIAVIMSASYAYAATNTLPEGGAGDGAGAISGYVVSNIAYHLNDTDPTQVDSVSFALNATAGAVKIKLSDTSAWYGCSNAHDNDWSCDTIGMSTAALNQLRVVAVSH